MAERGDGDPLAADAGVEAGNETPRGEEEGLGSLLSNSAGALGGTALLFLRPTVEEPYVAVARAGRPPSPLEAPPSRPIEPPEVLSRLQAPGAALVLPSRIDPLPSLDRATLELLESERAASMVVAAMGEREYVEGALAVLDAGRTRRFVRADAEVLATLALSLSPVASRLRHRLLFGAEQGRRRDAEARVTGARHLVELLADQLDSALITYDRDGICSQVIGAGARRLLRSSEPTGVPVADLLVPRPDLLAALERARAGEASDLLVELGGFVLDVRFVAQLTDSGAVVGGIVLATDVTAKQAAVTSLRESAGEAEAESEQRAQALERVVAAANERDEMLTSAIHDEVLQTLSALGWRLDALAGRLESDLAGEASALAAQVRAATARLGSAADEAVTGGGSQQDVSSALVALTASTDFGLGARHRVIDELGRGVPVPVAEVLLAVAAEAVANAATHARPSNVEVTLRAERGGVALVVRDDGRGFDPASLGARVRGRGIALMREQARLAGGWVRLESRPGRGTTIHAWLPLS